MNFPEKACIAALSAMRDKPKNLLKRVELEVEEYDEPDTEVSGASLLKHLKSTGPSGALRQALGPLLALWDAAKVPDWGAETATGTPERRAAAYARLGLPDDVAQWLNEHYPPHADETIVITASSVKPWYSDERKVGRFYWDSYRTYLELVKHWDSKPLGELDKATDDIVEQIADPSSAVAYQAKGLVVGYVQSGKTANFTGVVAKAIDAGYRHIIILTGTIELLRGQTQRRIDMEMLGVENLIGELSVEEATNDPKFDYSNDHDWPAKFMRLGTTPDAAHRPNLIRYTRKSHDYQELIGSAGQLKPVKQYPNLKLYDSENLTRAPAGIFIVKKNQYVLEKLIRDVERVKNAFLEIPVLIIDDESDQASVNTVDPEKVEKARREGKVIPERTAINEAISSLLKKIPRAQYLGYTATPFANVFIDPSDGEDLFPRDFVIGLQRPYGYMGASDFSDVGKNFNGVPVSERSLAGSNQRAYIRELVAAENTDARDAELEEALDAFVITGALKLYRSDLDPGLDFKHHTMLVHESVRMEKHGKTAEKVQEIWNLAGYTMPSGLERLQQLYEGDVLPVSAVRKEDGLPPNPTFESLVAYVGEAVSRISEFNNNPVIVVNGDSDIQKNQQQLDFDGQDGVWRVLIGGAKLSRGFTVEGLTISYYRRAAGAHDTLTQAGRWFGFRQGYRDLVRVYIGTKEKRGKKEVDLLEAFNAVVQDEEAFRSQLTAYARPVDGTPQLRPKDIPPLVSQHLFWLKPTANNKMFNAVLEEQKDQEFGPVGYPLRTNDLSANLELSSGKLLHGAVERTVRGSSGQFKALLNTLSVDDLRQILANHAWLPRFRDRRVAPWLAFFDSVASNLNRFAVVIVQPEGSAEKLDFRGLGKLGLVSRSRRAERGGVLGEPSEPRHRIAAERLAGISGGHDEGLRDFLALRQGSLLCYLVRDTTNPKNPPIFAFRIYLPNSVMPSAGPVVRFRAAMEESEDAVVDAGNKE